MNIEDIANEVLKIIRQNGVKIEDAIVLNNPDSAKELLTLTNSGDIAKISPETLLSTVLNRGMVYNGYIAEGVTIPIVENSFYLLTKEGQYTDSDGNTITIASKGLNVLTRKNNEWKVYAVCRLHDSITSTDADAYLSARAGNELYEKIKDLENNSGGGGSITVDSALSTTSKNPVQNKVITSSINDIVNGTTPVAKANVLNTSKKIDVGEAVSSTPQVYTGANSITIPITALREAYLQWGGKVISGKIGPLDCAMKEDTSKNRLSFLNPDAIDVEYSNDGGNTWLEYNKSLNYSEDSYKKIKTKLVTTGFSALLLSGGHTKTSSATTADMLRITINASKIINGTAINYFYFQITKIFINYQSPSAGKLNIEYLTNGDVDNEDKILEGKEWKLLTQNTGIVVSGNSGWNSIYPYLPSYLFGGGHAQAVRRLRFSFYTTNADNRPKSVRNIYIYASNIWTYTIGKIPLVKYGHMYNYDIDGNVTFPAKVVAPSFEGIATSVVDGAISEQKLGNSAVITKKIRDNNVTEEKLSTDVQAKLNDNPLRKLFLAEGALYNDTDATIKITAPWKTEEKWQQEEDGTYTYWEEDAIIDHLPGHYYLNGIGDITEDEMIKIYNAGYCNEKESGPLGYGNAERTNLGRKGMYNATLSESYSIGANKLEIMNISCRKNKDGSLFGYGANAFNSSKKLRKIIYIRFQIDVARLSAFVGCVNFEEFWVSANKHNFKVNQSFADCPNIYKRFILSGIKNASPTTAITIKLHPEAYARIVNQEDIQTALKEKNGYIDESGNEVAGTLPAGASINLVSA